MNDKKDFNTHTPFTNGCCVLAFRWLFWGGFLFQVFSVMLDSNLHKRYRLYVKDGCNPVV